MAGDAPLSVGAFRGVLKFATLADFAARLAVRFASAFSLVCFDSSCQKFADGDKRPGVLSAQANIATEAIANSNTRDLTALLLHEIAEQDHHLPYTCGVAIGRGCYSGVRGPQDRAKINVQEKYEMDYWSKKFGVTPDQLRNAVKKAGPSAAAVEREIKRST